MLQGGEGGGRVRGIVGVSQLLTGALGPHRSLGSLVQQGRVLGDPHPPLDERRQHHLAAAHDRGSEGRYLPVHVQVTWLTDRKASHLNGKKQSKREAYAISCLRLSCQLPIIRGRSPDVTCSCRQTARLRAEQQRKVSCFPSDRGCTTQDGDNFGGFNIPVSGNDLLLCCIKIV